MTITSAGVLAIKVPRRPRKKICVSLRASTRAIVPPSFRLATPLAFPAGMDRLSPVAAVLSNTNLPSRRFSAHHGQQQAVLAGRHFMRFDQWIKFQDCYPPSKKWLDRRKK